MADHIFTGSGVAIVTPMNSDGSVNYDEYGKIIDFQIENGTDAIIACGTTGESAVMDAKEHCEVIEYTVKRVNKIANHIIKTNDTIRKTAAIFHVSKSTVHKDIGERQIQNYIKAAWELLKEDRVERVQELRDLLFSQYYAQYQEATLMGNTLVAKSVLDSIAKIFLPDEKTLNLNADVKGDITIDFNLMTDNET